MNKVEKVKQALLSIDRKGMKELVEYMNVSGFFTSPGSTIHHGNYDGGLLDHCINLYNLFKHLVEKHELNIKRESMLICSFGHDLCKMGAYLKTVNSYRWNKNNPPGHAKLSIERLQKFIDLTPQEEGIIKYHMGMYGTYEFNRRGEYSLQELSNYWNDNKLSKLFYFCDDIVAQFKDIKK